MYDLCSTLANLRTFPKSVDTDQSAHPHCSPIVDRKRNMENIGQLDKINRYNLAIMISVYLDQTEHIPSYRNLTKLTESSNKLVKVMCEQYRFRLADAQVFAPMISVYLGQPEHILRLIEI